MDDVIGQYFRPMDGDTEHTALNGGNAECDTKERRRQRMNDQLDIQTFGIAWPLVVRFDVRENHGAEPVSVRVHHQLHDRAAMVMADE